MPQNKSIHRKLRSLFNLRADTDREGTVEDIRANVDFRSANAWTLVFAIIIASIGLNVNSTAVIIGAMLISPLMGPIVGAGLALGIYDFKLLKRSLVNLSVAVLISIFASAVYFLLSPISDAQSELLARTKPSFFDVLIALFGGAAGIVAMSRKEKGNAIPGVAIATALMPPLCTAGYGVATANLQYFLGAIYLFLINSVFISISTFIFVRYLKFHEVSRIEEDTKVSVNRWVSYTGFIVIIPSIFMVWYLKQENDFYQQADRFLKNEIKANDLFVVDQSFKFSLKSPKVSITIFGPKLSEDELTKIKARADIYSLRDSDIEISQSSISDSIERNIHQKIRGNEQSIERMSPRLQKAERRVEEINELISLGDRLNEELRALNLKGFHSVQLTLATMLPDQKDEAEKSHLGAIVLWKADPSRSERDRVAAFLKVRLPKFHLKVDNGKVY
ncbi:hypothetical protein BDW_05975 [Bdellovibrio bacteriovorus W]|nr:hypothetical protein BDW_05975 [Bdellovibrio bacteriovorus W]